MANKLRCYWYEQSSGHDQIWYAESQDGLTWEAKVLYYDFNTNPPPNPPFDPSGFLDIQGLTSAASNLASPNFAKVGLSLAASITGVTLTNPICWVDGNVSPIPVGNEFAMSQDYFQQETGIWQYNGALWYCGVWATTGGARDSNLHVWRSSVISNPAQSDFVIQDSANEPTLVTTAGKTFRVMLDYASGLMRIVFTSNTGEFSLVEFDLTANGGNGAWGAAHDPVSPTDGGIPKSINYGNAAGVTHVCYAARVDTTNSGNCWYAKFDGASWTTGLFIMSADVFVGTRNFDQAILLGDGITLAVTWSDQPTKSHSWYQEINTTTVALGNSHQFSTGGEGIFDAFGKAVLLNGWACYPFDYVAAPTHNVPPACFIGTGSATFTGPIVIDGDVTDAATCTYFVYGTPFTPPPSGASPFYPEYIKRRNVAE